MWFPQSLSLLFAAVVLVPGALGADEKPAQEELVKREKLRYSGKSFAEWRSKLLTELEPEQRLKALEAIQVFAANGYEVETAEVIVHIMGGYKSDLLFGSAEHAQVAQSAAGILSRIGDAAEPVLIRGLKSTNRNRRLFAAEAIRDRKGGRKGIVLALIGALKDKDSDIRTESMGALLSFQPDAGPLVPALVEVLRDREREDLHFDAVRLLGRLGPAARDALPALVAGFKEKAPSDVLRIETAWAIGRIGPATPEARRLLVEAAKARGTKLGQVASDALAGKGPEDVSFQDVAEPPPLPSVGEFPGSPPRAISPPK
jgi:hypothetical protein